MRKIELFLVAVLLVAIVFRQLSLDGGAVLAVLSITLLAQLYFCLSFALFNGIRLRDLFRKQAYQETNAPRIIGAVTLGTTFSLILIGILFKLLFWEGANVMMVAGLTGSVPIVLIGVIRYRKSKSNYYRGIFVRATFLGGLALVMIL